MKEEITIVDVFASQAMQTVLSETQEMKVASFWDWVKQLLYLYLNFTFLTVKFVRVENVYEEAAERAYDYAEALYKEKLKRNK